MSERRTIRIGTRASKLAMWQAEFVKTIMEEQNPDLLFEIVSMTTTGDDNLTIALSQFENKGVFTKELDIALLTNQVDVVVHCMKDLATQLPRGIRFCAVMEREDPDDCVILHPKYKEAYQLHKTEWEQSLIANPSQPKICPALSFLPAGAVIGTSALRRQATLARYHPTLICKDIRGNVGTRLDKLDRGDYDAIILAKVGVDRLGLAERISALLEAEHYLHAVGQAALAVVCRTGDDEMKDLFMASLHNIPSAISCTIERGMLWALQGGCKVPIAANTHFFVVPNHIATKQIAMIDNYRTVSKTLMGYEIDKRAKALEEKQLNGLNFSSRHESDYKDGEVPHDLLPPLETDIIPSHLYSGLTSLISSKTSDLRELILEQNKLVHSLDSDYEDGDDEDDAFRNSNSFSSNSRTPLQTAVLTSLASLPEAEPLVAVTGNAGDDNIDLINTFSEASFSTPVKKPLQLDLDSTQTRERKCSAPLTPRTQAQTWSLLVITRAAVISMNGQDYVETIRGEHFPLYLKSQFVNPISSKAWAIGLDLGHDLNAFGANQILDEIRGNLEDHND